MKKQTKNIERGEASFIADLTDGTITITHGTDKVILFQAKNAKEGSWDKIWETIKSIESVN